MCGIEYVLAILFFPCNTYCPNLDTFYKHLQAIARGDSISFFLIGRKGIGEKSHRNDSEGITTSYSREVGEDWLQRW